MDLPILGQTLYEPIGIAAGSSAGTQLTSGATHVKGAWAPLTATCPDGIVGAIVSFHGASTYKYYLDIGYGGAGSETVIVPDFRTFLRPNSAGQQFYCPIALPAGQRIAARIQSGASSPATASVAIHGVRGGFHIPTAFGHGTHYGLTTATTLATDVDPGAVAHTKGAWVPIVASTSEDIRALTICLGAGSGWALGGPRVALLALLDLGVGGAGSEVVRLADILVTTDLTSDVVNSPVLGPFECYIPAGSRIAARMQANTAASPDRIVDVSLIGWS